MEGIVEVCSNSTWWLVAGTYWDRNDTRVLCRQLGYPVECKSHDTDMCIPLHELIGEH